MASAVYELRDLAFQSSSLDGNLSSFELSGIVTLPHEPGDEDCDGDRSSHRPVDPELVRHVRITRFRTSTAVKIEEGHSENGLST